MKILALDTSEGSLSMGVFSGQKVLAEKNEALSEKTSDILIPALEALLKKCRTPWSALEGIVIGLGPGSFTGLRVSVTTAKTLAYALGIKIWGVSSLEAIARNVGEREGLVAAMTDAKRGRVYGAIFKKEKGVFRTIQKPAIFEVKDFLDKTKAPVFFTGSATSLYKENILNKKGASIVMDKKSGHLAKASSFLDAAWPLISRKKSHDLFKLQPLYLYPKDCNAMRSSKKK